MFYVKFNISVLSVSLWSYYGFSASFTAVSARITA
jgi:hypothetical protein